MTINKLMQNLFDCLYSNTTIDFYEEDKLFKFEFHGEISPLNLMMISYFIPLISSHGYVCSIGSFNGITILRVFKHDKI